MRIFNLEKKYNIVCNFESTRYGFRHIAILHKNGFEVARAKICYYNRTWEKFEFESVLNRVVEGYFIGKEKTKFLKVINDKWGY